MICQFSEEYSTEIWESFVNTWKAKYVTELDRKQKAGDLEAIVTKLWYEDTLPLKKRGCPLPVA